MHETRGIAYLFLWVTRLHKAIAFFILFIIFHRVAVDTLYCRVVFIYLFIFELALQVGSLDLLSATS